MFVGEYQHSLDDKGRLSIPAKFRGGPGKRQLDRFVLTRGLDNCLFLYSHEEWKLLEQKVKSLPMTRKEARSFARFLFSGAMDCLVDRQGRIAIPSNLREYAHIEKEVVVIGVLNRIEIWAKSEWERYVAEAGRSFEEMAERLVDLGI